jgi:hypothetical protein
MNVYTMNMCGKYACMYVLIVYVYIYVCVFVCVRAYVRINYTNQRLRLCLSRFTTARMVLHARHVLIEF